MSNYLNQNLNKLALKNLAKKHKPNTTWPMEKRIEAVSQYLVLGNMALVSAVTGISHDLLREWKMKPWWKDLENEIRATKNIEMDSKLSKIVDRSLDAVLDRLDNGDFIYNQKTGEISRKPVNMKDAAKVSVDVLTKRELLRGNATERKETTQISVNEQLKLLAAEFAKWQTKKPSEAIDVEFKEITDAVDEERPEDWEDGEGLREGESAVQVEAGECPEKGGEQQSPSNSDERGVG